MHPSSPHEHQPYHEDRPWGSFDQFTKNELSTVKLLRVEPGQAFSLQYHHHREELWHVLSGDGSIRIGERTLPVVPGETHVIPQGTLHRIEGGTAAVTVLEVSFGDFEEDDIVRVEDKYGRT
jgi:mannose-6-phosphate isomerase-like protein (cupin superfamily)